MILRLLDKLARAEDDRESDSIEANLQRPSCEDHILQRLQPRVQAYAEKRGHAFDVQSRTRHWTSVSPGFQILFNDVLTLPSRRRLGFGCAYKPMIVANRAATLCCIRSG